MENIKRARTIFNSHPDLTLLVRDERSLEFALYEFRLTSLICPDMAFALGSLDRLGPPTHEIVWLRRTDLESVGYAIGTLDESVQQIDWLQDQRSVIARINKFLSHTRWR